MLRSAAIYIVLLTSGILMNAHVGSAQCNQNVSFTNWKHTGDSTGFTEQWTLGANDTSVQSNFNTNNPQFFVGPDTLINVKITGKFRVEDNFDDDYVGFVFGFRETWDYPWYIVNDSMRHEYYLFDWKKNNQNYIGYNALEGYSLNEVNQTFARNIPNVFPSFWNHTNTATFQVLQTQFSTTNGWVAFQDYDFELYYTPTKAIITIDNDTIFEETGCFEPGLFGFYSFSQTDTRYWDFNYELFIDFNMEAEDVCLGDTAKFIYIDTGSCNGFNAFSNIDTFYWDLGDGTFTNDTNPQHVYDSAGFYDVFLIATDINGCTDTANKTVSIQEAPVAVIDFDNVCYGDSARFADSTETPFGSIVSWDWDFGDGNTDTSEFSASNLYAQSGTYTVELIVESNAACRDTVDTTITIFDPPNVAFTIGDTCDGFEVDMVSQSSSVNGALTELKWDIDNDGGVDYYDSLSIQHLYSSHAMYAAELMVRDTFGCSDSLVQFVTVFPLPEADFVAPSVCPDTAMVFYDSSSVATGQITSWLWSFGDGFNSNIQSPAHQFDTSGVKTVKLVVTSSGGCADSVTKNPFIFHEPIAMFGTTPECQYLEVEFDQLSTSTSGQINQYNWLLGDGTLSTNPSPIHAYSASGLFSVQLAIETEYGCVDTIIDSMRIYPGPEATFSWDNNVCEGDELAFYDQSTLAQTTPGGDQVIAWNWVVNDREITIQNPVYETVRYEKIKASLEVTTNYGCKDSVYHFPEIFPIPDAEFTQDIGCEKSQTSFKDESEVDVGIINGWEWDFGDGNSSSLPDPNHIYTSAGQVEVELLVTTTYGCSNYVNHQLVIPPKPVVNFSLNPEIGCSPLAVSTQNKSEIASGEMTYEWFRDEERVSIGEAPRLFFYNDTLEPVPYRVSLKATSDQGCTSRRDHDTTITVLPVPKASFALPVEPINMFNSIVSFENRSEHSVRWQWSFGDGSGSQDFAPNHRYLNSGEFTARLVAWNVFECVDTAYRFFEVSPISTLYIPAAFTPNGDGDNEVFNVQGFNEGKRFEIIIWDRWGHIVLESKDLNFTWDGRLPDNRPAPSDTYVYQILFQRASGEFQEMHGSVTLIR